MNLRDLEYLVALEEEKHFRKAAERCLVSQPTLSGQLRKLEDELGVILIERTSRKVLFTPAGDAMAHQARKVLKEVRELKNIGQHFAEPMSGEIHIGFIPTVGPYLLPHIIQDLREHFPKLEFYLYEEQTQLLLKRLEGLRQQLRQQPLSRETPLFVRASFGVINVGRVSMDEALSEADRLLYQAKNTGRDKIVCQDA